MDLSPFQLRRLADAVNVLDMLDLGSMSERAYLEIVGARLGGAHVLRDAPDSARDYVYGLLGLDESSTFEQALLCAARVGCTAPDQVKVHHDSALADAWDAEDAEKYGYGFYCCPSCTPKDMLLTDVGCTHGPVRPILCHVCGTDAGRTRCLWIHPQHLETATTPSPNRDSESDL